MCNCVVLQLALIYHGHTCAVFRVVELAFLGPASSVPFNVHVVCKCITQEVCVCVCVCVCMSVIISLCSGLFLCTVMQYISFVGVLFSA